MSPIKRIKELPTELPPARLYLDDVEGLVDIFREAAAHQSWEPLGGEAQPRVSYQIGEYTCDTIDELRSLGNEAANFRIAVGKRGGYKVQITVERLFSSVSSFGISEEEQWAVYAKVRAVFENRSVRWKSVLHGIPWWLWLTAILLMNVLGIVSGRKPASVALRGWDVASALAILTLLVLLVYEGYFKSVVLVLRYSHESKDRLSTLKSWGPYLLAGVLGAVGTKLVEKIFQLLWP
jgi:hypothetical protein